MGLLLLALHASAPGAVPDSRQPALPDPSFGDVRYGPHERNVLDLWLAPADQPTPLVIEIHGGGFAQGDKSSFRRVPQVVPFLDRGVSVAQVNYRLTNGGENPFPAPMLDVARAIQFLRHEARRYNLDRERFGALGSSAGGCILLWLGFHPDLARPEAEDPVLRESSRLQVLAPKNGQTSLHVPTLLNWFGVDSLREHSAFRPLFAVKPGADLKSPTLDAAMVEASPITYLSADDPPVYMTYPDPVPVDERSNPSVWVHHPIHGIELKEAMDALGIECLLEVGGRRPDARYASETEFVIAKLTANGSGGIE